MIVSVRMPSDWRMTLSFCKLQAVETQYIRNQSIESGDIDDQLDMDTDRLKMDEVAEDGWKVVEKRKKKQRG